MLVRLLFHVLPASQETGALAFAILEFPVKMFGTPRRVKLRPVCFAVLPRILAQFVIWPVHETTRVQDTGWTHLAWLSFCQVQPSRRCSPSTDLVACAYTAYFRPRVRFDARRSLENVLVVVSDNARSSDALHVPAICTRRLKRYIAPRLRPIPGISEINHPPRPSVPTRFPQLRSVTVASYSDGVSEPPGDLRPSPRQVFITRCRRPAPPARRGGGSRRTRAVAG